jgi:hypothetical protein
MSTAGDSVTGGKSKGNSSLISVLVSKLTSAASVNEIANARQNEPPPACDSYFRVLNTA